MRFACLPLAAGATAVALVLLTADPVRAADPTRPTPDSKHEIVQYKAPAGWQPADQPGQPTKTYMSPTSNAAQQAFLVIAVMPAQPNFDFPSTFDHAIKATAPNATITESTPAQASKTRQGFDALAQTIVGQNAAGEKIYVRMVGARVNDRMAALAMLASSKELYDRHQKDMDALLQSVSFDAPVPAGAPPAGAAAAAGNAEWAALEKRKQELLKELADIEAKQGRLTGAPAPSTPPAVPGAAPAGRPAGDPDAALKQAMAKYAKEADGRRKPNTLVGDILTLDGKPIPNVAGYTLYCGGTTIAGQRTHLNLEVDEKGHFEQKLPEGLYKVYATCVVNYGGKRVPVDLVSLDGKPMGINQSSDKGIVKDFRLVMTGLRPGEAPDGVNAWFGGVVNLADGSPNIEQNFHARFPNSKVRVTLTPTGPLLDGSAGAPVPIEVPSRQIQFGAARFQRIPIGVYRLSASLVMANGQTKPLGFGTNFLGPYAGAFDLAWEASQEDATKRTEPTIYLRD